MSIQNYEPVGIHFDEGVPEGVSWQEIARCAAPDIDPEIFDVDTSVGGRELSNQRKQLARAACSACVVQGKCLDEALMLGDTHLVRAGLMPRDLARLSRKIQISADRSCI